ncbi:hypothetical protein AAD001_02055 [Colwelliaceae bacterium 6471]
MKNLLCSTALVALLAIPAAVQAGNNPQDYPGQGALFTIDTQCTYTDFIGNTYEIHVFSMTVGATFKDTAVEYAQNTGQYYEDTYPHLGMDCRVERTNPAGQIKVISD